MRNAASVVLFAAVSSCAAEDRDAAVPVPPKVVSRGEAITALAKSVCARNYRCGLVGEGTLYGTPAVCENEVSGAAHELIGASECVEGVERLALEACLARVAQNDCGTFPTPRDADACSASTLCLDRDGDEPPAR
jgi:hypothetical protein